MSDDLHALAGLYALDALDDVEMRRFERHLDGCEPCHVEVAEFREAAQRMGSLGPDSPPAGLKARVMAEVASTPQVHHGRTATRGGGRVAAVALGVAASVVLVASLAVALVSTRSKLSDSQALTQVLADPLSSSVTYTGPNGTVARVVESPAGDRLVVLLAALPPIAADRAYAMWLVNDEGAVPVGLLRPGANGEAVAVIDAPPGRYHTFAVTEEGAGGSPMPTGPMLVSGPVSA